MLSHSAVSSRIVVLKLNMCTLLMYECVYVKSVDFDQIQHFYEALKKRVREYGEQVIQYIKSINILKIIQIAP